MRGEEQSSPLTVLANLLHLDCKEMVLLWTWICCWVKRFQNMGLFPLRCHVLWCASVLFGSILLATRYFWNSRIHWLPWLHFWPLRIPVTPKEKKKWNGSMWFRQLAFTSFSIWEWIWPQGFHRNGLDLSFITILVQMESRALPYDQLMQKAQEQGASYQGMHAFTSRFFRVNHATVVLQNIH